ncbi:MAG TPA: hypothetical protein VNA20_06680 [Frankiaceae bacterium]|nr:hypothetical protein [Frankiaceae bacterium]
MRELARVGAGLVALLVVLRDLAVAGYAPAMVPASVIVGLLVVAALAFFRDGLVTGSGVALAGHYLLSLTNGDVVLDLAAPAVGALVVVYLDLADLAAAVPKDRRVDRAFLLASARRTLAVLGIGALAGTAALALALVPWPALEVVRAAGALGVAAVVAVPLILLRRSQ